MFAGLEPEQYNIAWVQHTDKGRLELNFVIPNVEMTSGKRLQPYYDRADRPLAENFKQVINHEYSL
ncbi:relaxase/mobilization nuclease domain-containing protein, partial [Actinobacillus pleuropneumoniae]